MEQVNIVNILLRTWRTLFGLHQSLMKRAETVLRNTHKIFTILIKIFLTLIWTDLIGINHSLHLSTLYKSIIFTLLMLFTLLLIVLFNPFFKELVIYYQRKQKSYFMGLFKSMVNLLVNPISNSILN